MPRHRQVTRRGSSTRESRRSFLIVVGADRTEADYLEGLRDHARAPNVSMRVVTKPGSPDQLVHHVKRMSGVDDFDQVWCVTDVDHYEREGGKVTTAVTAAAEAGIEVAVSNPCFELWLLLHRETCTAACENCETVMRKLRKRLPAYDKTRLRFEDFAEGVETAIERARRLDPTGKDHVRNPSTGVWRLVSAILEQR